MLVPGNNLFLRTFGSNTCGYKLDDDGTMAAAFGLGFAPATAPSYQSITYTYTGTATGGTAITTPANPFASPGLFTVTDKTGIGFRYNTPVVASSSPVYFQVIEWQPGLGSIFRFAIDGDTGNVRCESGSGGLTVDFALSGVDVANAKFALSINANTNTVDYIVDGLNIGTASATFTTPDFFIVTSIYDTSPISPVGQTITLSIVPDAADLTLMGFPSGTVDLCGNPITYVPITCALPFSVPDAGITMSNSNKTATLTTASGTNSYATYAPYTTNFWDTPYVFPIGSGTHAFEWTPNAFPHPAGGATYWQQVANFTDTAGNVVGYVTLEAQSINYNIQLYLTNGPSSSSYTIGTTLPTRIGVAFDSSGPTCRVYVDGTQRLTGTYLTADTPIVINMNFETVSVAGGDIGQTLQLTYVSDAADMTGTYPAGATDKCGNLI